MANLQINNNVISSLKSIKAPDQLTEHLLQILEQSLLHQADSGGKDKSNLSDLKKIHTMLTENELNVGMKQQQVMMAYEKSIKSVEEIMESYGDKEKGILQKKVDDFLSDVPGLKDIASALQKENPIIGQTWKAISGTWNFAKKRLQKSKEAKEKYENNTKLLETQAKDIQNLESTAEESLENDKEIAEKSENILDQILKDIQSIRDNTDHLESLDNISQLTKSDSQSNIVEITNSSNAPQTIQNVTNTDIDENIIDSNKVVVERLDNIDGHIEDGIKDIIKYMSTEDEKEKRESLLTRLRNTKTTVDPKIKRVETKQPETEHDKESKSFFSSLSGLLKIAKPILAMFGIDAVGGMLNFMSPIKTMFSVLSSLGSTIVKFLPTILRIGGRLAIIGTVVMAIWDFVDGFAKTYEVFENQDDVTIADRIRYAYDNIIAGFIKLFDDVLGWFGLNFLDENTTQEDITKAIFEFQQNFTNSIKEGLNSLLDWFADLLPDWAVPDFRFDTNSGPKFKNDESSTGNDPQKPKRIFNETISELYENAKTTISESFVGDTWRWLTNDDTSTTSGKFNSNIKHYEQEAAKINKQQTSSVISNSGNNVNNVINNNTTGGNVSKTTSNPDLNFRSAINR